MNAVSCTKLLTKMESQTGKLTALYGVMFSFVLIVARNMFSGMLQWIMKTNVLRMIFVVLIAIQCKQRNHHGLQWKQSMMMR